MKIPNDHVLIPISLLRDIREALGTASQEEDIGYALDQALKLYNQQQEEQEESNSFADELNGYLLKDLPDAVPGTDADWKYLGESWQRLADEGKAEHTMLYTVCLIGMKMASKSQPGMYVDSAVRALKFHNGSWEKLEREAIAFEQSTSALKAETMRVVENRQLAADPPELPAAKLSLLTDRLKRHGQSILGGH